jgi:hypothetical protein
MFTIISPYTKKKIQIAENDFENDMMYLQAYEACERLGKGWRLPTESELHSMYKNLHKKGIGNFKPTTYWSSTDDANDSVSCFCFLFGESFGRHINDLNNLRAVRDLE